MANHGIGLRSITDGIDTAGTAGKLVFHIMAAMAEMERDLNRERTTAALIVARREGRVGGRKTVMTLKLLEAARKLLASGMAMREIAPAIGVSVPTLYRHLPAGSGRDQRGRGRPGVSAIAGSEPHKQALAASFHHPPTGPWTADQSSRVPWSR